MTHTIKQVNFLRDLVHKKRHIYGNAVYYYSDGSGTYPDRFRVLGVFFIKAHFTDPFVRIYSKIWFRVLPDSSLNHRSTPGQPPEGRLKKLLIWESASATTAIMNHHTQASYCFYPYMTYYWFVQAGSNSI